MTKFESLSKKNICDINREISKKWNDIDLLGKSLENKNSSYVFYDGPATANGMPGCHHMLAKILKDTFCKYQTMKGNKVLRKVGWDTHGLPVEVQVEKELGFNGKNDIEKYGIKKFNEKCRESVWKNEAAFKLFTEEMGQLIDLKNPYITYDNNFIETEWWILKKFFDAGLIYDGLKIVPYCPRCGTGLASHEVAQGYKTISVNTVYVPFKVKNMDNTYLLIWTTTPWTLMANVAACVNPELVYCKVKSKGINFILAESLLNKVLGEDYEVIEKYQGSELEGLEYDQFLPFMEVNKKAFYITCADYVTAEDGTGIVHIAPAFGQDDYEVGLKYNLPVLNPVNLEGKYNCGPWEGRLVVDSLLEVDIIKYLASEDKLFKKQKMEHDYPHCWRCKTPLIYYSKPSLYIKVTDFKDKIIEANKTVNWYPSFVGEKRFGNWLENLNDWAISRNRYWGTPIPLWKCSCGHTEMIGSREELVSKSIEKIDETVELHRPYVDDVHIKCSECRKEMSRVPEVMDCWFDSGSMPFAQYHYPFENKELWESQFPADFICEGIDQTRGWFYSLLVISVFLTGKAPYKNVLVNDLVTDKFGQKMHKSRGNGIDPFPVLEEYGADATRWFMLYASPVWTPLRFDLDGIKEAQSKFFNTLRNTYTFFEMYANADNLDPRTYKIEYDKLEEIDKWLISKYNKLVDLVIKSFDEYDMNKVVKAINNFVIEDLSNWYIRRNRRRFWKSENDESKMGVYQTTYEILCGVCKLIAPIAPFTSEEIYTKLTNEESVHLANYPVCNKELISDYIENRMDLVRSLISLGRNAREDAKIKVRQPINKVLIDGKNEKLISDLVSLIEEELNVKEVIFTKDVAEYMNFTIKPNFKVCGAKFGSKMGELQKILLSLSEGEKLSLNNGLSITKKFDNEDIEINKEIIDIRINAKDGFDVAMDENDFIIIDTNLTHELILEGIARELVSKVQQLRKSLDFNILDRITINYYGDELVKESVIKFNEFIKKETLADNINIIKTEELYDLNGHETSLEVKRNK